MTAENYLELNKKMWDARAELHVDSEFYDVAGFLEGKTSLDAIELELLGDIKGKSVLHLQCHFGLSTLSMARMGAKVTGVDFSDKAVAAANDLAKKANLEGRFICSDVQTVDEVLDEKFDIVFTSYGTIGWLPNLDKWGEIVSRFMKPNGRFVFVEFHPVVWMFDDHFKEVTYGYFNTKPFVEEAEGSYVDRNADIHGKTVSWNQPFTDVFKALLSNGLTIDHFAEYDTSSANCFQDTVEVEGGYQIKGLEGKLPMVYSLCARKK